MYTESLAALSDPDLVRIVEEMVLGPGQAELAPRDLEAQVAYHRSLIDGRPFLAITAREAATIRGEVTPGATVEIVANGRRTSTSVAGHTWTATLPAADGPLAIEATAGNGSTTLDPSTGPHSHTPP